MSSRGFNLKVQHLRTDPATRQSTVTHVDPYIAFIDALHGTVYLRGGACCDPAGEIIDPIPAWVMEKLQSVDENKLKMLGFNFAKLSDQNSVNASTIKGKR